MEDLPDFTAEGLFPAGDYQLSIGELRSSLLVQEGTSGVSRVGITPGDFNWLTIWRFSPLSYNDVALRRFSSTAHLLRIKITPTTSTAILNAIFVDWSVANSSKNSICSIRIRYGLGIPRTVALTGDIRRDSFPCGTPIEWNSIRIMGNSAVSATNTAMN